MLLYRNVYSLTACTPLAFLHALVQGHVCMVADITTWCQQKEANTMQAVLASSEPARLALTDFTLCDLGTSQLQRGQGGQRQQQHCLGKHGSWCVVALACQAVCALAFAVCRGWEVGPSVLAARGLRGAGHNTTCPTNHSLTLNLAHCC